MGAIHKNWKDTAKSVQGVAGAIASIAYQPIPKILSRKAREMGGDLIDLDDDVNRIIIEFNLSYWFDIDTKTMEKATQQLYQGTRDLVTGFQQSGKLPNAYLPLFSKSNIYLRLKSSSKTTTTTGAILPNPQTAFIDITH
jgi:hypothetical protein